MDSLATLLGIDTQDPEYVRAKFLAEEDHHLLRKLVALRKSLNLSQSDVAARLGITQPSVAAFERYDSDPKLSTVRRYAQVVGLIVGHRVEVDQGQTGAVAGGCWAGGWQSARSVTFAPSPPVVAPAEAAQRSVTLGNINAEYILAA